MKTTLKVIGVLIWIILISIAWCNPEKLVWKIIFTAGLIYIGWLVIAAIRAPEVDDEGNCINKYKSKL